MNTALHADRSTSTSTSASAEGARTEQRHSVTSPAPSEPRRGGRATWPILGAVGAVTGLASVLVSMPSLSDAQRASGVEVIDRLEPGGYRVGFVLGLLSVGCLLAASSGWRRWAARRVPDSLAGRTLAQGLAATATINVIFSCLMGSMGLYLAGGAEPGGISRAGMFTNFTLLDFGPLLGWWGAAVSAICVAVLAFGSSKALPRWMGVVSVVLLMPPLAMALAVSLPGFVGLTMPIWLLVISIGMVFSRAARA